MSDTPEPTVTVEFTREEAEALITAAEGGYLNLDDPRPALAAISLLAREVKR